MYTFLSGKRSMNKKIIFALIGTIVIVGAVIAGAILATKQGTPENTTESTQTTYKVTKACDLLSLEEAKTFLGANTTLGETNDPAVSPSLSVDTCSYRNGATNLDDLRVITISTRSALDQDGYDGNVTAFDTEDGSTPAAGDQVVTGYGDKARWDTTLHQLTILKGSVVISIVYGGTDQTMNSFEDTKKVADVVLEKNL